MDNLGSKKDSLSRTEVIRKRKGKCVSNALNELGIILTSVCLFVLFSTGFDIKGVLDDFSVSVSIVDISVYKRALNNAIKFVDNTYDSGTELTPQDIVKNIASDFIGVNISEPEQLISARLGILEEVPNRKREQERTHQVEDPETHEIKQPNGGDIELDNQTKDNVQYGINDNEKNNVRSKENSKENSSKNSSDKDETLENKENNDIRKGTDRLISYEKDNVLISNLAGVKINKSDIANLKVPFQSTRNKCEILIYHTHTSEDYVDYGDYGVLQSGRYLKSFLDNLGVKSIHNATIHDKVFNLSYSESFATVTSILKGNRDIDVIIDLHRDAVGKGKLRVLTERSGKRYAQLMFVVGTDKTLYNPGWRDNLSLAMKLHDEMNRICPGIMRPIYLTDRRYNQNMSKGSLLIEVGGDGNEITECKNSMKVFAMALDNVLYKSK